MSLLPSGPIVAVIDDDSGFREIVKGLLESDNFQVVEAENTETLSDFVDHREVDCLLIDYRLGEQTGFHAMDTVARSRNADAPIIMMTGSGEQKIAIKAFRCGVADFLPKRTLGREELRLAINKAIEGRRQELADRAELETLRKERATDIVTGFYNGKEFAHRVEKLDAIHSGQTDDYVVIVVQLDAYYDELARRFGPKQADNMIREVANRSRALSNPDDVWGRIAEGSVACLVHHEGDMRPVNRKIAELANTLSFQFRIAAVTLDLSPTIDVLARSETREPISSQLKAVMAKIHDRYARISRAPTASAPVGAGMAGESAPREDVERRASRRTRVLKSAKIMIGPSTIDCAIRNVSDGGLRLRLEQHAPLPSRFEVYTPETGKRRPVALRWQHDRECGVEYTDLG